MVKIFEYQIYKQKVLSRNYRSDILIAKKNQDIYSAKMILREISDTYLNNLKYQSQILSKLENQFVIKFIDFIENQKYAVLITQLAHKDLKTKLLTPNKFSYDDAKNIMKDLLLGLKYIHTKKIVHCHIQPSNIMFTHTQKLKIIDFGRSILIQQPVKHQEQIKINGYQSPQFVKRKKGINQKSDIWSAGVVFYELIFRKLPFQISEEITPKQFLSKILAKTNGQFMISSNQLSFFSKQISTKIQDFFSIIFKMEPDDRANIQELLNHEALSQEFTLKIFTEQIQPIELIRRQSNVVPKLSKQDSKVQQKTQAIINAQYIKYKLPYKSIDYLQIFDEDIYIKKIKIFKWYLLKISVICCQSFRFNLKDTKNHYNIENFQKFKQTKFFNTFYKTVDNDYWTMISELESQQYQYNESYPYDKQQLPVQKTTFLDLKGKFRQQCNYLSKLCFKLYSQNKNRENNYRAMLLRLCLRITILSLINRIFTHQKCQNLDLMKDYWEFQSEKYFSLPNFNTFLDKLNYQRISVYLKELTQLYK